jgi:putative transposase
LRYRHSIGDEVWNEIKDHLPGNDAGRGVKATDTRLFVDGVLFIAKTGISWRDLPERYGKWNSVFQRFNRWSKAGVWVKIFKALQDSDHGLKMLLIDSTTVRASQEASGALKKGIQPVKHKRRKHWADPEED